jgi:hypothetical protein
LISGDDALIGKARQLARSKRRGKERTSRADSAAGRATGNALVVVGAEAGEHGVGLRYSGGTGKAEFADQTVLASAPGAFDAPLGLGRVCGDLLDAEFFESASELGGSLFASELFGDSPV